GAEAWPPSRALCSRRAVDARSPDELRTGVEPPAHDRPGASEARWRKPPGSREPSIRFGEVIRFQEPRAGGDLIRPCSTGSPNTPTKADRRTTRRRGVPTSRGTLRGRIRTVASSPAPLHAAPCRGALRSRLARLQ